MTTCRGTWNDLRVPMARGMVTMCVEPYTGDDALVGHPAHADCLDETPHRMFACGMFLPPRPGFAPCYHPSRELEAVEELELGDDGGWSLVDLTFRCRSCGVDVYPPPLRSLPPDPHPLDDADLDVPDDLDESR